jgi:hypothetical protein
MINAKQSHEQKQKPATKVPEKQNKSHNRVRLTILTESAVSQMTTPRACSLKLHSGPRCQRWKATGYSVNSAECGTMKMCCNRSQEDVYLWET